MGRAIGIANAIGFRTGSLLNLLPPPTNLVSSFNVDTISGELAWTDNSGGTAEYEVYSSFNGGAETLLATTAAGATSYADTTCKQNASVVYRIRAKEGAAISAFVQAAALATPLCWKTDQSTLSTLKINFLNIAVGKTVTVNYSDGTSQSYTGLNSDITKDFASTGQYNVWLTGDINDIEVLQRYTTQNVYGNASNWVLPQSLTSFVFAITPITGAPNWIIPENCSIFNIRDTSVSGLLPKIQGAGSLSYQAYKCNFTGSDSLLFKTGMTLFDIREQNSIFPTSEIDKLLLNLANFYEVNAPTVNVTINMSGANMGIPTGGSSNADLTRLVGYYTAAGFTCNVLIRTS